MIAVRKSSLKNSERTQHQVQQTEQPELLNAGMG
jgi:hypothetical protein